jgi:hypothetical protein
LFDIASVGPPVFGILDEKAGDQTNIGILTGKHSHNPGASTDLLVQTLENIRRRDLAGIKVSKV